MRIARYRIDGEIGYGVLAGASIEPLPEVNSVGDLLARGLEQRANPVPMADVRLLPPVPLVRNPFCVGWNYDDHFAEGAGARGADVAPPEHPTFFTKATTSIIGPDDEIARHADVTDTLDWEVEVAVVIGRPGTNIDEAAALDHVLGFTIANDVSARNVQREHGGQWFRGKSLDATSPIGPWIVTPDDLEGFENRTISCRVNGELVQEAVLGDMHFGISRIIAELSRGISLLAGDVILTGTPSGVGFARTPPRFLKSGDIVESEVGGIGRLRNVVGA